MGHARRWRSFDAGRRRVGRHEARPGKASARRILASIVGVVAIAAVAVFSVSSSGSHVADPHGGRPSPPASNLIAAPGFGAGLEGWRAFPGTYVTKGRLGDPTARYARVQRDPTVPAVLDPSTRSPMAGLATRVRVSASIGMPLRVTVRVRGSKPGTTVLVRLSERIGDRRIAGSERRTRLRDTAWRQVGAGHQVLRAGASIHLEIWALALPPDEALDVGQAKVTSP
jgi:hypothetical protein